jgi:hypothetical protein
MYTSKSANSIVSAFNQMPARWHVTRSTQTIIWTYVQHVCHIVMLSCMQGYHMVKTQDIPAIAGCSELASSCLATTSAIMQLLKETCRTDGASYVLQIDSASQVVCLYELKRGVPLREYAPGLQHSSPSGSLHTDASNSPSSREDLQLMSNGCAGLGNVGTTDMKCTDNEVHRDNGHGLATDQRDSSTPLTCLPGATCEQPATVKCSAQGGISSPPLSCSEAPPQTPKTQDTHSEHVHEGPFNVTPPPTIPQPYATRVARLCYQMSRQLLQQSDSFRPSALAGKGACPTAEHQQVQRLLDHCLQLADRTQTPQLTASALLRSAELAMLHHSQKKTEAQIVPIHWKSAEPRVAPSSNKTQGTGASAVCPQTEPESISKLTRAAALLSEGLNVLCNHAKRERTALSSTLKARLVEVYQRLAFEHVIQGQPGRAHRFIMLAGCHLRPAGLSHGCFSEQESLRQLLRCSGLAYLSMVCHLHYCFDSTASDESAST